MHLKTIICSRRPALLFALGIVTSQAWSQAITTFAGTGSAGFASGNGGPATSANIGMPMGLAVDASGNVYIADGLNQQIRKVDTSGNNSLFAGGGVAASLGDGGAAVSANIQFAGPHAGMAFDKAGNMYVADLFHNRIRKIDTNGIITTFAGTGSRGFSGDSGPATSAQLAVPQGVTVDSAGNVYIADNGNGRVRKVDTTGTITTVAGAGLGFSPNDGGPATATLFQPIDVAVDATGDLYIADTANFTIRKVTNGTITSLGSEYLATVCGNGHAGMGVVDGLSLDPAGNLFTAESAIGCVHKIDAYGDFVIVAGGGINIPGDDGPPTAANLTTVDAVALD
jgi:trimeric autotransporter adhesin